MGTMRKFPVMAFILVAVASCSIQYDTDNLRDTPTPNTPLSDSGVQPATDANPAVSDAGPVIPGLPDAAAIPDTGPEGCGELGDDCGNDWVECDGAGQCVACGGVGGPCCLSGDACQVLNLTCNLELNQCLL